MCTAQIWLFNDQGHWVGWGQKAHIQSCKIGLSSSRCCKKKDVFEPLLEILKVHKVLPLFSLRATFLSRKFSCSPETCNAGEASVYFPCPDINRTALVNCSRDILHSNNRVAAKGRSTWAMRLEICGLYFKDGAQSIYSRWKLQLHTTFGVCYWAWCVVLGWTWTSVCS